MQIIPRGSKSLRDGPGRTAILPGRIIFESKSLIEVVNLTFDACASERIA
jgi:hypothetical protein